MQRSISKISTTGSTEVITSSESRKINKDKESNLVNHMKEDLGHMKCFKCHEMGHHAYLCPHKKKAKKQRKQFARSAKSLVEVNELASKLETTFHGRVVCG